MLTNELLSPEDIDAESANAVGVLFAPDDATEVDFEEGGGDDDEGDDNAGDDQDDDGDSDSGNVGSGDGDSDDDADDPPFGGQREEATPEDGLGAGATLGFSWTLLLAGVLFNIVHF